MFCWWRGIFLWPLAALAGLLGYEAIKDGELKTLAVPTGSTDALEILKIRYARGEITKIEYNRIKKDIT